MKVEHKVPFWGCLIIANVHASESQLLFWIIWVVLAIVVYVVSLIKE
jgi:hypothetical protein